MKRFLLAVNIILFGLSVVCLTVGYELMAVKGRAYLLSEEILDKYRAGLLLKDISVYIFLAAALLFAARMICYSAAKRKIK